MGKKIVIALGGNALGSNLEEQRIAVKTTAKAIADLIADGNDVVVTHGNGPQVGMIQLAMEVYHKVDAKTSVPELSVSVAMSQAYIGSDLQRAISAELDARKIQKSVSTIVTHVVVDKNDEAFKHPTKPIGSFLTKAEADVGGIPVVEENGMLTGVPAVIDKDFASAKLAADLNADCLIILTAVEKVAINFNKPDQKWLSELNVAEAKKLIGENHFAKGSMLPKVEAAIQFAESNNDGFALITLLEKAQDGIKGKTGTVIKA